MIQFEGSRPFPFSASQVASKLFDAGFLAQALDTEKVLEATPDKAVWKQKTGFSFLSATLDVTLTVLERTAESAKFKAVSKGIGASSTVEAQLQIVPTGAATCDVKYSAQVVERTGLIKLVSPGLIQSSAKTVIEDTWKGIEGKIG